MLNERIILYTEEAEEKGEEKTIQIFNAISSLISENESDSEIAAVLVEQFGITEEKAYKRIEEYKTLFSFQH